MATNITLLDLVHAVAEYSRSDAELTATVVYMVNRGHVRLCGSFKGSKFDLTRRERLLVRNRRMVGRQMADARQRAV